MILVPLLACTDCRLVTYPLIFSQGIGFIENLGKADETLAESVARRLGTVPKQEQLSKAQCAIPSQESDCLQSQ